jgi:hypothetical protein
VIVEAQGRRQTAVTDPDGAYVVSNVRSGTVTVTGHLNGFSDVRRSVQFDQRGQQVDLVLELAGGLAETVTVTAAQPTADTAQSTRTRDQVQARAKVENETPSVNVQNLQRRASGVLPVRMEVPRAGTSHRFVKPLVIDEETLVTFRYKRR